MACTMPALSQVAYGGPPRSDLEILSASMLDTTTASDRTISAIARPGQGVIARYNPVSLTFTGLMYVYQRYISPQLPSECLYEHSCSSFSKSLIAEYGMIKGVFTTADRLMRCNRIAATDIHPLSISEASGRVKESVDIYKSKPE